MVHNFPLFLYFPYFQDYRSPARYPRGPEIERGTPKTVMYQLASFIKICVDHFGAGAEGLVSGTVSFLYVIGSLQSSPLMDRGRLRDFSISQ